MEDLDAVALEEVALEEVALVVAEADLGAVGEAEAAHFECQLEPIGDPTLRIEWLHNGQPLPYSSRIQMSHDFGFVALDSTVLFLPVFAKHTCSNKEHVVSFKNISIKRTGKLSSWASL